MLTAVFFITECPLLEPPCNGMLDVPVKPIPGNVATYGCEAGFELTGNNTRICQEDHTWDGIPPCCQQVVVKACSGIYLFTLLKSPYSLTICMLVLSDDNLCIQIGPISDSTFVSLIWINVGPYLDPNCPVILWCYP